MSPLEIKEECERIWRDEKIAFPQHKTAWEIRPHQRNGYNSLSKLFVADRGGKVAAIRAPKFTPKRNTP